MLGVNHLYDSDQGELLQVYQSMLEFPSTGGEISPCPFSIA